jgi:hypothetical protein
VSGCIADFGIAWKPIPVVVVAIVSARHGSMSVAVRVCAGRRTELRGLVARLSCHARRSGIRREAAACVGTDRARHAALDAIAEHVVGAVLVGRTHRSGLDVIASDVAMRVGRGVLR